MSLTWKINKLTTSTQGSLSNVVTKAEAQCIFTSGSICRSSYAMVKLRTSHLEEEGQEFTEFDDLTEDQVIDWVKTNLGQLAVEELEGVQEGGEEASYVDERDTSTLPSGW